MADNIPNFKCAIPSTALNNALFGGQSAYTLLGPDGIPQTALANLGAGVRPRLGINMDFTVNQRGQQSYTTVGYTLDGWRAVFGGGLTSGSVDFNDPGVTITANGPSTAYLDIQQYFEDDFLGKTLTFSVLYADGTFLTVTGQVPASAPSSGAVTVVSTQNTKSGIWIRLTSGGKVFVQIRAKGGYSVSPVSAKPEEGEGQTLVYQDGDGVWQLLPQPDMDYATQLTKCLRYQLLLTKNTLASGRTFLSDETSVECFLPTPTAMRINPTFVGSMSEIVVYADGSTYTAISVQKILASNNGLSIAFSIPAGVGVRQSVTVNFPSGVYFDANL